jgi:hypothetical protein
MESIALLKMLTMSSEDEPVAISAIPPGSSRGIQVKTQQKRLGFFETLSRFGMV